MQQIRPRVGVGSVSSSLEVGADRAPQAAEELARVLSAAGCETIPLGVVNTADAASGAGRKLAEAHADSVALAAASWFEDYLVLDLLEECDAPMLLWSLPGMETGALCGAQQATSCLAQLDKPYRSVFGAIQQGEILQDVLSFLRAAALRRALRRARIGLVGARPPGMTEVSVNELALKKALGPRVVPMDMAGLLDRERAVDRAQKEALWRRVKGAAAKVQVPDADGLAAAGAYLAIQEIIRRHGLSALAYGCYPDYMGHACLAASLLADEGIPIACEGDVNGAVGMLILMHLTGQATHNTDWLDPLPDGSMVFTHCGSGSHALAQRREDITLSHVRLAGKGVCSLFPAKPGAVTLVNVMPIGDHYRIAVLEGEALPTEMVFPGNPLRVNFGRAAGELIQWIADEGIGHHWMAGYGHVKKDVENLARVVGPALKLLEL